MLILISPAGVINAGIALRKNPMMDDYIFQIWKDKNTSDEYHVSRLFVAEIMRYTRRHPITLYYNVHKH